MRHFLKFHLVPLLSLLAVAAFPCVFLYAQNCQEVGPEAMVPFLMVYTLTGLILTGIYAIFFRNVSRAVFLADLSLLVIINFGLLADNLKKLLPFFRDRYLLLLFAVLLLGLFILLLRKKPDLRTGCTLVLIAFGAMMTMNMVFAVPTLVETYQKSNLEDRGHGEPKPGNHKPDKKTEQVRFGENKPNVYYFIFDEYGGYENLQYYYDYDNSPFLEQMEERGFSVARESRNTEAVETITIVPNLLNLDYVAALHDTKQQKNDCLNRPKMQEMFQENGYQVQLVNHTDYLETWGTKVLTGEQTRRTISEILLKNSLYSRMPRTRKLIDEMFSLDYSSNYRRCLDDALEAGLCSWETAQDQPTLTIGYIQCPHSPTMVGRHGERLPFNQGWNWLDHSLYLNQLEFVNDYILKLTDTIQEHDPEAMIIYQSDHGNRYPIHMWQIDVLESYDPYVEEPYMKNILNCVYYQGQQFPIEGQTGINTLRLVFREVLEADLPPVEPVYTYFFGYEDEVGA